MVPHFLTALDGAPSELGQHILDGSPAIERWFRLEWTQHTPVFYSSVDIRNAGFKLAPVDTNLYPGGWNNLSAEMLPPAAQAARLALQRRAPQAAGCCWCRKTTPAMASTCRTWRNCSASWATLVWRYG